MPQVTLQEKIRREDTMVYWKKLAADKYDDSTYLAAEEIPTRWNDKSEEFKDDQGTTLISRALVYPGKELVLYSYMYHGAIADLPVLDKDDPEKLRDSFEILLIKHYTITPWIRKNHTLYQYYLI